MKQPTEVTVVQPPASRRRFNAAYLRALAAKAKPRRKPKAVVVRCTNLRSGLRQLLRAFEERV